MGDLGCSAGHGGCKGEGQGSGNPLLAFVTLKRLVSGEQFGSPNNRVGGGQKTAEKGRHGQRRCVRLWGRGGKGDEGV